MQVLGEDSVRCLCEERERQGDWGTTSGRGHREPEAEAEPWSREHGDQTQKCQGPDSKDTEFEPEVSSAERLWVRPCAQALHKA